MVTALALHPAERRRLTATLPHEAAHDVVLQPLGGGGGAALIVSADEQSYIEAVLADLKRPDWRAALAARRGLRRGGDAILELNQPIHRRFHLALFEASCRMPGSPRLDPKKIDGMGLVLRREIGERIGRAKTRLPALHGAINRIDQDGWEGWMTDGPVKRGWLKVAAEDLDPDPSAQNRTRGAGQSKAITTLIQARRGGPSRLVEQVMPLFVAPPDVCDALGKTVLYGLVPVASPDTTDAPPPAPNYAALEDAAQMRQHLSSYLKARPRLDLPHADALLDPASRPLQTPVEGDSTEGRFYAFAVFLQQLMVELGAFEPTQAAGELMRLLDAIRLPTAKDVFGRVTHDVSAAEFVRAAAPILVGGEPNFGGVRMPLEWPAVGAELGGRLTETALVCLATRFAALAPKTPKFAGDENRYAVRGFLRVRVDPDCPPRLFWSHYSEPFRILPWWDSDGPAARISLPAIGKLRNLKPNVSFELPPELANLLAGSPDDLKDGKGSTSGIDIYWLCSFSLPIITICAFIVLSIFLSLFNLVFGWLAWIKICIPIPRPK